MTTTQQERADLVERTERDIFGAARSEKLLQKISASHSAAAPERDHRQTKKGQQKLI